MIGPHEGQELELMLAGKKRLAAFGDIIPENGIINEQIIPEKKLRPYVQNNQIKRIESEIKNKNSDTIKYVCFTLSHEEWSAHAYIFIRKQLHLKAVDYTDSIDQLIEYLLDYSQNDIDNFLIQ
jgi:hypothetical protein